jgi:hypothetical protein
VAWYNFWQKHDASTLAAIVLFVENLALERTRRPRFSVRALLNAIPVIARVLATGATSRL